MKYSVLSVFLGSLLLVGCGGGSDDQSASIGSNPSTQDKSIFENTQLYYTFDLVNGNGKTYKSTINLSIKSNGNLSGEWNSPYGNLPIMGSAGNNNPDVYLNCYIKGDVSSQCLGKSILNTNPGLLFIAAYNDSQKGVNCGLEESIAKNNNGSIVIKSINHVGLNAICKDSSSGERYVAKDLNVSINGAAPIMISGATDDTNSNNAYINWSNSVNGTTIKDGNNLDFAVQDSDGIVVDLQKNVRLNGTQVLKNNNADLVIDGKIVGNVGYATASNGSQITVFNCSSGGRMTFTSSGNQYTWNCPNGSSGNSGGDTSKDNYLNWNGNANGSTIKDGNNRNFAVYSSNGMLVDLQNDIELQNATVNKNNANLLVNGKVIGSVVLVAASNGSKIAVFNCSTGGRMTFTNSGTQYTWHCPDGGTGSTSGSSSGTSGGRQGIGATLCVGALDQSNGKRALRNNCSDAVNVSYTVNGLSPTTYTTLRVGESTFNTFSKTDQVVYNACLVPSVPVSANGGCNSY